MTPTEAIADLQAQADEADRFLLKSAIVRVESLKTALVHIRDLKKQITALVDAVGRAKDDASRQRYPDTTGQ